MQIGLTCQSVSQEFGEGLVTVDDEHSDRLAAVHTPPFLLPPTTGSAQSKDYPTNCLPYQQAAHRNGRRPVASEWT
ncbi:hypothetical protein GCM10009828_033630 [Actinoplanes couchii]